MITKALIKHIISLQQVKFRNLNEEFIAEGVKLIGELIKSRFALQYICATHDWISENQDILSNIKSEIIEVSTAELVRISALSTPNRVLAVFKKADQVRYIDFNTDKLVLVLDELRDPGNLGTIVRIADWFGITDIVCSPATVDIYNPKTVQSTMGSIARVNVIYKPLEEFLNEVPEAFPIFGTTLKGENIYHTELPKSALVLIGSESHGLSDELLKKVSHKLFIPSFGSKAGAESLNVSAAAAIICSEFRRRN